MKIIKLTCFIISLILLQGCATTTPLSAENRQSLHTITLDTTITKPKEIYILNNNQNNMMAFGGIIGGIIATSEGQNTSQQLATLADKNRIVIDKIVREELISQLKQQKQYRYQAKGPADAILVVEIKLYGLTIPHGFTSELVPIIHLQGKLLKNEKIIWQSTVHSSVLNSQDLPHHKWDEIMLHPKYLVEMWQVAASKMVREMLSKLN